MPAKGVVSELVQSSTCRCLRQGRPGAGLVGRVDCRVDGRSMPGAGFRAGRGWELSRGGAWLEGVNQVLATPSVCVTCSVRKVCLNLAGG